MEHNYFQITNIKGTDHSMHAGLGHSFAHVEAHMIFTFFPGTLCIYVCNNVRFAYRKIFNL